MYVRVTYLSLMILAFAKHSKADLIRISTTPGVFVAIGYWLISQNISVPGSRPRVSVPGRIEMRIIFANDIPTCNTLVFHLVHHIYISLTNPIIIQTQPQQQQQQQWLNINLKILKLVMNPQKIIQVNRMSHIFCNFILSEGILFVFNW